jgi:hypothetical protein
MSPEKILSSVWCLKDQVKSVRQSVMQKQYVPPPSQNKCTF